MSAVHMHLLLNHVPVIGVIFVAFVLAIALWRRNDAFAKLALVTLAGVGLVATVVFLTGEPAEEAVEHLAGVSEGIIHDHEEAAEAAFIVSSIAATIGVALLAWFRRRPIPRPAIGAVFALLLAVSGLMARAANLGGQIRHTEISGGNPAALSESDDH